MLRGRAGTQPSRWGPRHWGQSAAVAVGCTPRPSNTAMTTRESSDGRKDECRMGYFLVLATTWTVGPFSHSAYRYF